MIRIKKNIKFLFVSIIFFISLVFFTSPDVYAYKVKYQGIADGSNLNIEMPVKADYKDDDVRNWATGVGGVGLVNAWNNWGNASAIGWGTGSYGSYKFGFHKSPNVEMNNSSGLPSNQNGYSYVAYNGIVNTEKDLPEDCINNYTVKQSKYISKLSSKYGLEFRKGEGNTFFGPTLENNKQATVELKENYFIKLEFNQNLVFSKFVLNKYALQSLIDYASGKDQVYFSSALATNYGGSLEAETSYDLLERIMQKPGDWFPNNWGCDWYNPSTLRDTALANVVNYYDNIVVIPDISKNKVRVDHVYRKTDGTQQRVEGTWQDVGKKITVNRDNDKIKNKDRNGYIGYTMITEGTEKKANKNKDNTTNGKGWNVDSKVTIEKSDDTKYTIVTYYYDYRKATTNYLSGNNSIKDATITNYKTRQAVSLGDSNSLLISGKKYNFVSNSIIIYDNWKSKLNQADTLSKVHNNQVDVIAGSKNLKFGDKITINKRYEYEPARQVYIRHLVYNNKTKTYELNNQLTNSNEVVYDYATKKYKLVNNGYNQRGGTTKLDSYHEAYTIDYNDSLFVDRSRSLRVNGTEYVYQGYNSGNSTSLTILSDAAIQGKNNRNITRVTLSSAKVQKTYVDFYYKTKDVPPPGETPSGGEQPGENPDDVPGLDFTPKDTDGKIIGTSETDNKGCKTIYVPSGENLKAYMSAVTHRAYTLIYKADSVDDKGNLKYSLKDYQAYKYTGGQVVKQNGSSSLDKTIGMDKESVFSYNNNMGINISADASNSINQELKNSINSLNKTDPMKINTIADGRKTTTNDFPDVGNIHNVATNKYNGLRIPKGTANYNVVSLVSNGTNVFNPTNKNFTVNTNSNTRINVFTPLVLGKPEIKSVDSVNHSTSEDGFTIQKNSTFTIVPKTDKSTDYSNISDTGKYLKYYWIKLDFDIKLTNVGYETPGGNVGPGQAIKAQTFIKIPKGGSLTAIATSGNSEGGGDTVSGLKNNIKIIGVTYNMEGGDLENAILTGVTATSSGTKDQYIDSTNIKKVTTGCDTTISQIPKTHEKITSSNVKNMYGDAKYMAQKINTSRNLSRLYDFKITDCLDVNYKNVFRKENGNNTVNDLTGVKYFSGIKRLLIYGGTNNILVNVTDSHLNDVASKTILPLGPQKHTAKNYLQAPKMGYRISFDLKTSGTYTKNSGEETPKREIRITPSYYYIDKNGENINREITLYYKNASGKYVNFNNSGYTIYFKPNDGYRMNYNIIDTPGLSAMSTKLEPLKIGSEYFTLTDSMMATSDNNFIQSWYGEFKLPNSTIAVPKGGDINNPLTNGYIAVKFNIECITKDKPSVPINETTIANGSVVIVGYGNEDLTETKNPQKTNTTQWDYEAYLGFGRAGNAVIDNDKLKIPTDNSALKIQGKEADEMYKFIKGTVALFDLDNRAANDFE